LGAGETNTVLVRRLGAVATHWGVARATLVPVADRTRRERLLTFLLLPAIVVAVLVLLVVTFQSSFKLEKLREQSVVEATLTLANEKADRLDKRIVEQDNAVLSLVDVGDRVGFGADWLAVAARQTPTVRGVLLVDLSSPAREVVAFASRAPPNEAEAFRRLLVSSVLDDLELGVEPRTQLRHLHRSYRGHSHLLSYWQRDVGPRRYLLVAWHDVPRIVHDVFPALYSNKDDHSRVNVVDADGRIVFGPPLSRGGFTLGKPFQTTLYKWRLNATLISAEELAEAVARRRVLEMALVALSLLVVIAGLTVVLVAAARERKLSNLKSDFVANVSHELKTPLSLVRMFGELLQSGRVENDEKRRQYVQIIVTETERLGALIENVLDFARAERGKSAYEFARASLPDVLSRAVEVSRVHAQREGVELVLELDTELPMADLDARAIELAVINLVDNALKHAPDGKRIVVAAHRLPPVPSLGRNDQRVEIRVTDEGPGIPAEDRKRIFERFVRGNRARESRTRGSGIGLALVKHIAEAHGGRAWVENARPRGSTFVFTVRAGSARRAPQAALRGQPEACASDELATR
jgi:two-component system, OmpR family, phosphate regulon sensor histidine kinase PhoR